MTAESKPKPNRRRFLKYVGAGAVAVAAAGVAGYELSKTTAGQPASNEVKVGFLCPLTGYGAPSALWGSFVVDLFFEEFNKAGGIPSGPLKGTKINLITADIQSDVAVAMTEAERLIAQEHVSILIGAHWSSFTKAILPILDRYHVPMVADGPSSPSLNRLGSKYFFRPGFTDEVTIKLVLEYLKDAQAKTGVKAKTLALFYSNDECGVFGHDTFMKFNEDPTIGGYEVVADLPHALDVTDLTSEIAKLKAANPDIVLCGDGIPPSVLLVQGLWKQDINPMAICDFASDWTTPPFVQAVGNLADGICERAAWAWDISKPVAQKWDKLFYDRHGAHILDGRWWLAAYVVAKALETAGSTDPEVLQKTLYDLKIPADEVITSYGVDFEGPNDPDPGMNKLASGVQLQFFKDPSGDVSKLEYHTVWPFDVASKKFVFPVPTWKQRGL